MSWDIWDQQISGISHVTNMSCLARYTQIKQKSLPASNFQLDRKTMATVPNDQKVPLEGHGQRLVSRDSQLYRNSKMNDHHCFTSDFTMVGEIYSELPQWMMVIPDMLERMTLYNHQQGFWTLLTYLCDSSDRTSYASIASLAAMFPRQIPGQNYCPQNWPQQLQQVESRFVLPLRSGPLEKRRPFPWDPLHSTSHRSCSWMPLLHNI